MEGGKPKILLVDDDNFLIELYVLKFVELGYEVKGAPTGKDALDMLRAGFVPDVIIYDIIMNKLAGFSFLETMHAENLAPDAYLIALTNQTSADAKDRAQELGTDLYIVKAEMIPQEVVERVKRVVEERKK